MSHRRKPLNRWLLFAVAAVLALGSLTVLVRVAPIVRPVVREWLDPNRLALRALLADPSRYEMRQAYAARDFRPIWIVGDKLSVEAEQILTRIEQSAPDGLDPGAYGLKSIRLRAASLASASDRERALLDVDLTSTYAVFIHDLHQPADGSDFKFTDSGLTAYRPSPQQAMSAIASARFPRSAIINATRTNAFYEEYRKALGSYLTSGAHDENLEQSLRVNLERSRALPSDLGRRFVFVDITDERLWLYENGVAVDSMKVVVGTPSDPTPALAALIRYAVFNPFWNVPPDLTMRHYAPLIAADLSELDRLQMDPWTDFSDAAQRLDPTRVNWTASIAGRQLVWLRQRPGPHNAMGHVKFMFPNAYGVYLHDTPNRDLFAADARASSAGCVRVEDYHRLARWLYEGKYPDVRTDNQTISLPEPVPVYLAYLTAVPMSGRIDIRPDPYGKDNAVAKALAARLVAGRHA